MITPQGILAELLRTDWPAEGYCRRWDWTVYAGGWADAFIWLAYMGIPAVLLYVLISRTTQHLFPGHSV